MFKFLILEVFPEEILKLFYKIAETKISKKALNRCFLLLLFFGTLFHFIDPNKGSGDGQTGCYQADDKIDDLGENPKDLAGMNRLNKRGYLHI